MSNKIFLIGLIVVFVPITSRIRLLVIGYLLSASSDVGVLSLMDVIWILQR